MRIDSKTKLMGVIGDPIEHSKSPLINNYLAELTNTNIAYLSFLLKKEELFSSLLSFMRFGTKGLNVTIPHKTNVIEFLDDIDEDVRATGACNTIKIKNGRFSGYNTDIEGFYEAFRYDTNTDLTNKKIVLLGAGGATKGILYSILKREPLSIFILNRSVEKAAELAKTSKKVKYGSLTKEYEEIIMQAQVIINTTSVGMKPNLESSPLHFFNNFSKDQIVYDIIYDPIETKLLTVAKKGGAKTSNGLSMLIFQALHSFEIINETIISDNVKTKVLEYVSSNIY